MKRTLSLLLSLVMLFSITAGLDMTVYAASVSVPKKVTSYAASQNSITVSWDSVKSAKKYYVYCSNSKNGKYKKIATVKTKKSTVNKLKANTKYYFKVKAVNGKKVSNYSSITSCKTHRKINKDKLYAAYYSVLKKYLDEYGVNKIKLTYSFGSPLYGVSGVNFIKLIDFNNDGLQEMVVSKAIEEKDMYFDVGAWKIFGNYDVYTYYGGAVHKVLTNRGYETPAQYNGYNGIQFRNKNHTTQIVSYIQDSDGTGELLSFNGKKFTKVQTWSFIYLTDKPKFKINGKSVSEKTFDSKIDMPYFNESQFKKNKYIYKKNNDTTYALTMLPYSSAEKLCQDNNKVIDTLYKSYQIYNN